MMRGLGIVVAVLALVDWPMAGESAAQLTVVDEVVLTAAENAPEPPDQTKPQDDVDQKLRVAQRTLDAAKSVTPKGAKPPEELTHEVDLLQQIKAAQSQLAAAMDQAE